MAFLIRILWKLSDSYSEGYVFLTFFLAIILFSEMFGTLLKTEKVDLLYALYWFLYIILGQIFLVIELIYRLRVV